MIQYKQNKLFIIINTLGNNKDFKAYNNAYINQLAFIKIYNNVFVLRIKKSLSLLKTKKFNIFFFNYIKRYSIGIENNLKNNLKNNFKFFIYSLYKNNIVLFRFIKNFINIDSIETLKELLKFNIYYPYIYSNSNLSDSFFYNFLYKDLFTFHKFESLNKFYNYSYLRSNKKKRFKQKESEKLSLLRDNLNWINENPFRLKFYYRYFEYKRLHSYWNKEAFLQKKFKYFNPKINNNIFLLHFFYKFRKFRNFSNKYNTFKKKIFINFWLKAKIKKFQFFSYKLKNKNRKTGSKFSKLYLNSIFHKNNYSLKNNLSLLFKYKKYLFYKKQNLSIYLTTFYYKNILLNKNIKSLNDNSFKKGFLKFFYSYNNIKNSKFNKNFHFFYSLNRIKNFNKSNISSSYFFKKKKNLNSQLFDFNLNKSTKFFLFDSFKKSKFFRIKFKYIKWLNQQKILKNWKFNKYLSYKGVLFKNFKNNLNLSNFSYNSNRIEFKNSNPYNIQKKLIYNAKLNTYNWLKYDFYLSNFNKTDNIYLILNNLKQSSDNYFKNFSFYKSNKILDQKYTYLNLFKNSKLNSGVFKNKSKNSFLLQKLSISLFKKSWLLIYKKFSKSKKYKGFYNLVPIYNYFFINKVIKLYKRFFTYKLLASYVNLFQVSLNKNLFHKNFSAKYNNNNISLLLSNKIKLNLLNRIFNIRLIDKKYSFKKRKERQLLYSLKNYKNIQSLLILRFKKNFEFTFKDSNTISKHKEKYNLLTIQKIIKKLKYSLNFLSNPSVKQDSLLKSSFKINYFKKSSFINFIKYYYNNTYHNNSLNNILTSSTGLYYNIFLKKTNINKTRSRLLKLNKIQPLFVNNSNLNFLDKLLINKIKKKNTITFNWGLNFLLKKNYFTFLRLFKFFSLYKWLNTNSNSIGFGRLSNYLNINNENVFSWFNFYIYNFLNFSLDKMLFLSCSSNYLTTNTYNNFKFFKKINPMIFKKYEFENNNSNNLIPIKYNYDILNKGNIISKIIYSKHYILKYWTLLNINKLFRNRTLKIFKTKNYLKKFSISLSQILFLNFSIEQDSYSDYNITIPLKKIYYNIINNYKNILFL
jgi:hypothetical protein